MKTKKGLFMLILCFLLVFSLFVYADLSDTETGDSVSVKIANSVGENSVDIFEGEDLSIFVSVYPVDGETNSPFITGFDVVINSESNYLSFLPNLNPLDTIEPEKKVAWINIDNNNVYFGDNNQFISNGNYLAGEVLGSVSQNNIYVSQMNDGLNNVIGGFDIHILDVPLGETIETDIIVADLSDSISRIYLTQFSGGVPSSLKHGIIPTNLHISIKDRCGNGICDADNQETIKNCPLDCFPDSDGDGETDDLDGDDDNDGVIDEEDNCPLVVNPNQANLDEDSKGDLCDEDIDGDNIDNDDDACEYFYAKDNKCNVDLDLDGIFDKNEYNKCIHSDASLAAYVSHYTEVELLIKDGPFIGCFEGDFNFDGIINNGDVVRLINHYSTRDTYDIANGQLSSDIREPIGILNNNDVVGFISAYGKRD